MSGNIEVSIGYSRHAIEPAVRVTTPESEGYARYLLVSNVGWLFAVQLDSGDWRLLDPYKLRMQPLQGTTIHPPVPASVNGPWLAVDNRSVNRVPRKPPGQALERESPGS
jgi:hypothetical protein